MPKAEEDGDIREIVAAGKVRRELAPSRRGRSRKTATHNTKCKLTTSYPMVLISACASSTMNALGCHSRLAPTAFFFNSVIQGKRSICLLLFVMMKAISTPLCHLSNTITIYRGNCTHRNGTLRDSMKGPIPVANVVLSNHRPRQERNKRT
jgi:hypothetical protein